MDIKKQEYGTSFFEVVSSHNLERFHSETIAWLFNTLPNMAKEFILKIHQSKNIIIDEKSIKCEAETKQIDIKLHYRIGETEYYIFIENKLKATEGTISYKKWSKDKDIFPIEIQALGEVELSQTEYYYFREINKYPKDCCHFVYLVPNKVNEDEVLFKNIKTEIEAFGFDFKKLNQWNSEIKIDNPWQTITYAELATCIKKTDLDKANNNLYENQVIAASYIKYISREKFKEFIDLDNFNKNSFGQFEYFKLLLALVKSKFDDKNILNTINKNGNIFEFKGAGSANGGLPLFTFYKKIKTDGNFQCFEGKLNPDLELGIQVQGDSFKYYVSAHEYDTTVVSDQDDYSKFAREKLLEFTKEYTDIFPKDEKGYNPNKTKTFYSRSFKIKNFIETDKNKKSLKSIFTIADEISIKVNDFFTKLKD